MARIMSHLLLFRTHRAARRCLDGVRRSARDPSPTPIIGDEPAVTRHISQDDIDAGKHDIEELIEHGRMLFEASFNTLDGAGRPELTGDGTARRARMMPQNFNRISGPDANSCVGCHNLPATGGGGDNVANVFTRALENPFVDFDGDVAEGGSESNARDCRQRARHGRNVRLGPGRATGSRDDRRTAHRA